jgi:hypothetical protein
MLIETTINIQNIAYQRLCKASGTLGRPRRFVISWLLRRLADESKMPPVSWSRIRYQERDEDNNWEKSHLFLSSAEYELFLDLKKVYKMSGSYLIAHAIAMYLNELLRKSGEIADNYRFTNYGLSRRVVNRVVCWTQYWGIPPQLMNKHCHQP